MRVLYAASEMVPYASTGGLADVAQALPEALVQRGIEMLRILPCYRQVIEHAPALRDTEIRLTIPVGLDNHTAEIWIDEETTPVTYYVRRDEFFDRTHLYGLSHRDYDDNFERFAFFQKAIVALLDTLEWKPDIVHANDWQTGLLPLFLRHGLHGSGRAQTEKTVFTIHNLAYQGIFPGSSFAYSNLPFACFNIYELEYYNQINCLKSGIVVSNMTTTVSPTYAGEICTAEHGCGLEGVLQDKGDRLTGILNGVSDAPWNPRTDPHIAAPYSPKQPEGKRACKRALLETMRLEPRMERPLIGIVTRLAEQKGLDILAEAMDELMRQDVAVALLGTGQQVYHELCKSWAQRWPARFAARIEYNTPLAHQVEAGADLFLMPSRFEPCGLNQLYSLKYGTVPLVHATGGLKDTITDYHPETREGNGFSFTPYSAAALLDALRRALDLYNHHPEDWRQLLVRIMSEDHSWDHSAGEYIRLYERTLET